MKWRQRLQSLTLGCRSHGLSLAWAVLSLAWAAFNMYPENPVMRPCIHALTHKYVYFVPAAAGISKGMAPPPPLVSTLTSVLCISIALLAFFIHGRSGTVLAVSAFSLLVLNVLAIHKPRFAQLASSLFGLFYCGEHGDLQLSLHVLLLSCMRCTLCTATIPVYRAILLLITVPAELVHSVAMQGGCPASGLS